jgi:uncharacterized phage protein (TIGR01671 family)
MREIKFRAWHKNNKSMCQNVTTDLLSRDYLEFMQYTGLKDSKGIEIYEEDIVEKIGWEGEYYKIVFDDYGFKLYNLAKGFMSFTSRYEELFSIHGFNVVGNMYESKERLEVS